MWARPMATCMPSKRLLGTQQWTANVGAAIGGGGFDDGSIVGLAVADGSLIVPAGHQLTAFTGTSISPVPTVTSPPSISGQPQVGDVLTANPGAWSNSPTSYDYQWESCATIGLGSCTPVTGATSQTFTPTEAYLNDYMRVQVTAANTGGTSAASTSPQTGAVVLAHRRATASRLRRQS